MEKALGNVSNNSSSTMASNTTRQDITVGKYQNNKIVYGGVTHYKYSDCKSTDIVTVNGYKVHKASAIFNIHKV